MPVINRSVRSGVLAVAFVAAFALTSLVGAQTSPRASIIIREAAPGGTAAERFVRSLGGSVTHDLPVVGGFSARVPVSALPAVNRSRLVVHVWRDAEVRMSDYGVEPSASVVASAASDPPLAVDGAGITVALVDTGIANVPGFGGTVTRVDLTPDGDGLDRYGHGTHMAGIVGGDGPSPYAGVAPGVDLVSVKVAGEDGVTSVSTVLAGLQWVATNRDTLGIRVLNLAFGTDSTQSYAVDPLDYAVEQLWQQGVTVVAAAGNRGPDAGTLNKPGDDPYVITVGAAGPLDPGAPAVVAAFSSRGPTVDGFAKPDLIGPGTSIVSLRAPGSTIDVDHPQARLGDAYFLGTGTSQAAATVAGVAALVLDANPALSPDEVKAVLVATAAPAKGPGAGAGLVDAAAAVAAARRGGVAAANSGLTPSTGLGLLELSAGSFDAKTWSAKTWSAKTWSAKTWSTLIWN